MRLFTIPAHLACGPQTGLAVYSPKGSLRVAPRETTPKKRAGHAFCHGIAQRCMQLLKLPTNKPRRVRNGIKITARGRYLILTVSKGGVWYNLDFRSESHLSFTDLCVKEDSLKLFFYFREI